LLWRGRGVSREYLTYRDAGVDRNAVQTVLAASQGQVRNTYTKAVIGAPGHFAGLFHLSGYRDPVLVSTIDGVGTKTLLAAAADRLAVVGHDAIVHGVNDVAVLGATPVFALDYLAAATLAPEAIAAILRGVIDACREEGMALLGGESAQMPGIYSERGLDVVATVVGVAERMDLTDGSKIRPGDVLIGMASSGLHTNGYTLARTVLTRRRWSLADAPSELGITLADALLAPHRSYRKPLHALLRAGFLRGAAHITGGGIPANLVRILPPGCRARVWEGSWEVPPIFGVLARAGNIPASEMFQTFNMGIGMIAVTPRDRAGVATDLVQANGPKDWIIGEVVAGEPGVDMR